MNIQGELLIGSRSVPGNEAASRGVNPASGEVLEPAFGGATLSDLDQACALAHDNRRHA